MLEERLFDDQAQPVESHVYVWSPRYVDAPILRDWYDDEGTLDADERLYYLNDANFNVTALVGLAGEDWTVVERYVYDPYGETTVYDAEWSTNPQSPIPNPFRYCGYFFDGETSLYNVRWRIYHSTLSTWLTRDPLLYSAGDPNLYRYVSNLPTRATDPFGLKGLGVQIRERYMLLASINWMPGASYVITYHLNLFGVYHEFDDDGHVAKDTKQARREFLANFALEVGVKKNGGWWWVETGGWRSIYPYAKLRPEIEPDRNIRFTLNQPSFWLGGMHDFEANGRYEICFSPHPMMPGQWKVQTRLLSSMKWRWVDAIDARSIFEYEWTEDDPVQGVFETTLGDLIGDKVVNADYWIRVNLRNLPNTDTFQVDADGKIVPYVDPDLFDEFQ